MASLQTEDDNSVFRRQILARSREHVEAMAAATERGWHSVAVGILRQELDSMVRVIYLGGQPEHERRNLLSAAVRGERWTIPTTNNRRRLVTDSDMVQYANSLHGWTKSVYHFGCNFIHLSNLHDYNARDPFQTLEKSEREQIAGYLVQYHGGNVSSSSTFDDVIAYAPKILDKISSNLRLELERL